jgi:hypothetical protein
MKSLFLQSVHALLIIFVIMKRIGESDYVYRAEVKLKGRENSRMYKAQHVLEMFVYYLGGCR